MWIWVLLACAVAYATKLVGYLIPRDKLDSPAFHRVAGTTTVGLLAALIVMNTFADGQALRFDARLVALGWRWWRSGCARRTCWRWCWEQPQPRSPGLPGCPD